MASLNHFSGSESKPSLVMSSWRVDLSSSRSTIFSPKSVGQTLTRKSISFPPPTLILIRPSWGRRRSEMSRSAMIFKREVIAFLSCWRAHHLVEHPVDPEPYPEVFLIRLNVDVGSVLLDRVEQNQVHQLHHRRLV